MSIPASIAALLETTGAVFRRGNKAATAGPPAASAVDDATSAAPTAEPAARAASEPRRKPGSTGAATETRAARGDRSDAPQLCTLAELLEQHRRGTLPEPQLDHASSPTPPEPPIHRLPPLFRAAVDSIVQCFEVPKVTALACLLSVASFVVQRIVDVEALHAEGEPIPTSLFLLTTGKSGERKSSVDRFLFKPVRAHEEELERRHEEAQKLRDAAKTPQEAANIPDEPIGTCMFSDCFIEALLKMQAHGYIGGAIITADGSNFLYSRSMAGDNQARTGSILSDLWSDGSAKYQRSGEPKDAPVRLSIRNQRLAAGIMIQPEIVGEFLSSPILRNQGVLPRFLYANPATTIGTRHYRRHHHDEYVGARQFCDRAADLLEEQPGVPARLATTFRPRLLELSKGALEAGLSYANRVEPLCREGGRFEPISGHAVRSAEQALRIAAVIAYFDDPNINEVSEEAMRTGIALASFYLLEAERAFLEVADTPEQIAKSLGTKLQQTFDTVPVGQRLVTIRSINRKWLRTMRAREVEEVIEDLTERRLLIEVSDSVIVDGHRARRVWFVNLPPSTPDTVTT
ncbi:MAG: DUF3987 domain-containing protein [Pseudomonadota bacterium]